MEKNIDEKTGEILDEQKEFGRKPFAQFMQELDGGATNTELAQKLQQIVMAVRATDKPGVLILSVKVTPTKNSDTVIVVADIKEKIPQPDRRVNIFFPDGRGRLHRNNPDQMNIEFREIK